ncbi:MAG: hypothetical protein EBZ48_09205 [Proteobacteria bacterium]|nr:hypothetical protein [Pseudomonadota bacterium]
MERYDSPTLLDLPKALEKFAYGILNPVKDRLIAKMGQYPGVSSYQLLKERKEIKQVKDIPRNGVPKLKDPTRPYLENDKLVRHFLSDKFGTLQIVVDPTAIRLSFPESRACSKEEFYRTLDSHVDLVEAQYQEERGNASVIGADRLRHASILAAHTPAYEGKKMLCLATNQEDRVIYIKRFRALCQRCEEVLQLWRQGYINEPYPPGMFPPAQPRMANMMPGIAL